MVMDSSRRVRIPYRIAKYMQPRSAIFVSRITNYQVGLMENCSTEVDGGSLM